MWFKKRFTTQSLDLKFFLLECVFICKLLEKCYVSVPKRITYWSLTPFVLVLGFCSPFQSLRNHYLDQIVTVLGGLKVICKWIFFSTIFYARLEAISSDHSRGFHIFVDHLLVENTDRQIVMVASIYFLSILLRILCCRKRWNNAIVSFS